MKALLLAVLVAMVVAPVACVRKVDVQSGTRVLCRYGHVVREDVKTLTVDARKASDYAVTTEYLICDRHQEAEDLLRRAAVLLRKGEKAEAAALVKKAFAAAPDVEDPDDVAGKAGVKRPGGGTGTGGDGGSGGGGTPGGSGGSGGAVVSPLDLAASLPATLTGYQLIAEDNSAVTATRRFKGTSARPKELVVHVNYVGSKAAYDNWFRTRIKDRYALNKQTLTVGTRSVYFGTDGSTFATAVWRSGGAALQVEASARSGSPAALKDALVAIVKRMP